MNDCECLKEGKSIQSEPLTDQLIFMLSLDDDDDDEDDDLWFSSRKTKAESEEHKRK